MSPSLRPIASTVSFHWSTSRCRSECTLLNSSLIRSSSICRECASVTPLSALLLRSTARDVSCSICSVSFRILASSDLLYFSRTTWSSSFRADAPTHCSSSSWFQFMPSLKFSVSFFARVICFASTSSLSRFSADSFSSSAMSLSVLARSRCTMAAMCSSVSASRLTASRIPLVASMSARTTPECSTRTAARSLWSVAASRAASRRVARRWISAWRARHSAFAKTGSSSSSSL
mmetsp:Transcript_17202/g.34268  ORF Transcript_17202/g.34268 Transcript_17202/m.34268 type:complete len:233 (-) Transcript_17202:345-1043(-)